MHGRKGQVGAKQGMVGTVPADQTHINTECQKIQKTNTCRVVADQGRVRQDTVERGRAWQGRTKQGRPG